MFKTAISCIFVLTFSFFSTLLHSNLSSKKWVFHYQGKEYIFSRKGTDRGHALVDLKEIAKRLGLKLTENSSQSDFVLRNPRTSLEARFSTRHKTVISFWGNLELSAPVLVEGKSVLVPIDFGDRALRPLLLAQAPYVEDLKKYQAKNIQVVIDPGHGANDFGTKSANNVLEKNLVLEVAQLLNEELLERGVQSALTRTQDSFLTLPERTKFANEVNAELFLSLHFNFDPFQSVRGFEIFVLSLKAKDDDYREIIQIENQVIPQEKLDAVGQSLSFMKSEANLEDSLRWAKSFRQTMKKYIPELRNGVKMAPFYVLWGAKMPSLLLELGYINNQKDLEFYQDKKSRAKLLSSLAEMISLKLKGQKNEKKL